MSTVELNDDGTISYVLNAVVGTLAEEAAIISDELVGSAKGLHPSAGAPSIKPSTNVDSLNRRSNPP